MKILALLLFAAASTLAQIQPPVTTVQSDPGGACQSSDFMQRNARTGQYWVCGTTGVWAKISPASVITTQATDPTGAACDPKSIALRTPSGALFSCANGVYAAAGGGAPGGASGAVQFNNAGALGGDAAVAAIDPANKLLLPLSEMIYNVPANTGPVPAGVLLWGNKTYGCVGTPGVSDPTFGGCAPVQFSNTWTDPTFCCDVVELSHAFNPSGDETMGAVLEVDTYLQGTHNFTSPASYQPVGSAKFFTESDTSGTVSSMAPVTIRAAVTGGGTVTNAYGAFVSGFDVETGGHITNGIQLYMATVDDAASTTPVTNAYFTWMDADGVGRCKYDATFNSVHQAICATYNPQFTKYTPGAANYERVVYGQWNSNVIEIGAEAGGTGVLRPVKLLGASLAIPGAGAANTAVCWKAGGVVGWASNTMGVIGTTCN